MTPCTEGSRHGIHTDLARKFRNQMRRNEIAKLPKNAEFGCGWFGVSFFHLCRVTELKNHSNHFFLCFNQDFYGTGVRIQRFIQLALPEKLSGARKGRQSAPPSATGYDAALMSVTWIVLVALFKVPVTSTFCPAN